LRETLEEYLAEISLAYYYNDAYGTLLNTDEIYSKYENIFKDKGLIKELFNRYKDEDDLMTKRSYLYLYKTIAEEFIYLKLRDVYEEYYNKQANLSITVDGEVIPYRDIGILIYTSDDSDYREKLYLAENILIKNELNPLLIQILEIEEKTMPEIGYNDYTQFWQETRETDFKALWNIFENVLYKTDDIAKELLEMRINEKTGQKLSEIKPWDRSQIWREDSLDEYFPEEDMLSNMKKLFAGLGVDFDLQTNVLIDTEDRPKKDPRAGTYTIKVPDDIRVICKPSAGLDDYVTLLHEMGHAEHYAFTDVEIPEFEDKGDIGTSETYAFLIENLMMNPLYLTEELNIPEDISREIIKRQFFSFVYSLRYYIAKLYYEPALHSKKGDNPAFYNEYLKKLPSYISKETTQEIDAVELYRYIIEKILFFPRDTNSAEAGYLLADESFYTIYYLKAWLLSSQLEKYLENEYSKRWYKNADAGEFLISLWRNGEKYPPEDISKMLGYEQLNAECLLDFIKEKYEYINQ
jgi:oligoendopeptidase F